MARVTVCNDCDKRQSDKDYGWSEITLNIVRNDKHKTYGFNICRECYDRIVVPTPDGILRRMLSLLKR